MNIVFYNIILVFYKILNCISASNIQRKLVLHFSNISDGKIFISGVNNKSRYFVNSYILLRFVLAKIDLFSKTDY